MGQEGSEEEIAAFMEEKGYTYPVLMDTEGELFASYGIMSFPTTFMIDRDGNVFGYVSGYAVSGYDGQHCASDVGREDGRKIKQHKIRLPAKAMKSCF